MIFRYAVSFESDTQPVETFRGEVDATDAEDAAKRALFRAGKARAGKWKFRTLVVTVEAIAWRDKKSPNKSAGRAAAISSAGPVLEDGEVTDLPDARAPGPDGLNGGDRG